MKKTMRFSLPLIGAALILALAGCQREGEKVSVNPTFDPETQTVQANFILSVSTNTGKDTKTTAEMAQVGTNAKFLGMSQVHMLAYELDDANKSKEHGYFFFNPVVKNKPVAAKKDFDLGTLLGAGAVSNSQSSRAVELALPLGTNAVAFYGKAIKTEDNYLQGSTIANGNVDDLTSLTFSLEPLLASMDAFDVGAFFFSRFFTYLCSAAMADEKTYWTNPTGETDKSYGVWFPIPSHADSVTLGTKYPNPLDQQKDTLGGIAYTYYHGEISWKNMGHMYAHYEDSTETVSADSLYKSDKGVAFKYRPLVEALGEAYHQLTTIKSSGSYQELRAGSASAVLRVVQDLYSIFERCESAVPTSWEEEVARLLADELNDRIQFFFTITKGNVDYLKGTDGKFDVQTLKKHIEMCTSPTDWSTIKNKVAALSDETLRAYFPDVPNGNYGFPVNVGLPFGAAIITTLLTEPNPPAKDHIDQFSYIKDIPAYGFDQGTFNISNYRYPPELMYYGNSALRTSVSSIEPSEYPASVDAWNTESQWSGWNKFATVTSTTRSVAMINNINYGTALLRSNVRYGDGVTVLKDNNAALHPGEEDHEVNVNTSGGLLVTGIVVGGQADVVGWDYTRRPNDGAYAGMTYNADTKMFSGTSFSKNEFEKIVYDRVIGGYTIGQTTTPIYTFLWDNYNHLKPADDQDDVYVGIEIYNNTGSDFWGEMNLIRDQGVFYLLGKLDLSVAVETAREDNSGAFTSLDRKNYCYPPYNPANGETINAPRVFMQDYMTQATLILNQDCLKHAYVTLPDLRSSQVSLGVSIDMSWTPGLAFEVIMGEK